MSASLPGVSEPILPSSRSALRAVHRGVAQHVARRQQRRRSGGRRRPLVGRIEIALLENHLVHEHPLHVHAQRICVKKSAVSVHSTSTLSDGSMPRLCILRIGGSPWRMFISIGTASETCAPTSLTFCQRRVRHARHVDEEVVGADPDVAVRRRFQRRARRKSAGCRTATGYAPRSAGRAGVRSSMTDRCVAGPRYTSPPMIMCDELVARREPLVLDARRVVRVLVAGASTEIPRALEITERGAAPGIEERLDRGVRVLRRVMDLRDVVHGRDAVVELAQATEQLVDVHVLRPVHRGELVGE